MTSTRLHPLPMYIAAVPAGASRCTWSKPLTADYRISEILMDFPAGTSLNLLYRYFMVVTAPATAIAIPTSGEIVQDEISPGYFAADGVSRSVPFQFIITEISKILVFAATNNTASALNAASTIILERRAQ